MPEETDFTSDCFCACGRPITKPRAKLVVAATSNTEELARAPRPKLLRRVDVEARGLVGKKLACQPQ
eukprot:s127_g9.t1